MELIFCIIHRQAIVEKQMNPKMYQVLHDIADEVHFIATRPLHKEYLQTIMRCVATTAQYFSDLALELDCMSWNTINRIY